MYGFLEEKINHCNYESSCLVIFLVSVLFHSLGVCPQGGNTGLVGKINFMLKDVSQIFDGNLVRVLVKDKYPMKSVKALIGMFI